MTPEIPPALTPEEWAEFLGDEAWLAYAQRELGDRAGDIVQQRMHTARTHTAAALALHGQAFGFVSYDAVMCKRMAEKLRRLTGDADGYTDLDHLAARIAALLPPEPTT